MKIIIRTHTHSGLIALAGPLKWSTINYLSRLSHLMKSEKLSLDYSHAFTTETLQCRTVTKAQSRPATMSKQNCRMLQVKPFFRQSRTLLRTGFIYGSMELALFDVLLGPLVIIELFPASYYG